MVLKCLQINLCLRGNLEKRNLFIRMCILGVLIIMNTFKSLLLYYYLKEIPGILVSNACIRWSPSAEWSLFPSKIALFSLVLTVFLVCSLFKISGYDLPPPLTSPSKKIYRGLAVTAFP